MLKPDPTTGKTDWFVHDRFGVIMHWGIYALAGRHEWVKSYEEIGDADYQRYFDFFDPDLFHPKAWARAAREAGMKYFTITTKHHDGFCLWDSKYTDWKVTNTKFGRDVLHEIVDAFRAEGLRIGLYYSLLDWHHPHFPVDVDHPQRNHPDAAKWNETRDIKIYAQYMRDQVTELLTEFGAIDMIWFDFSDPDRGWGGRPGKGRDDWQSEELIRLVRRLAPDIIINNRLDLPDSYADTFTPEQYQPAEWVKVDGKPVVWETTQTFSGSWGYYRDEMSWKSPEQLIRMLINTVSCGGNLLMNVGPTGRGTIDDRALRALGVYAEWMKLHSRSIYGCTQSDFEAPTDVRYTQNGNRLYAHLLAWPFQQLRLPGLAGKVAYAQLLNDASEIRVYKNPHVITQLGVNAGLPDKPEAKVLTLELPVIQPDVIVPVIELFLKD